MKDKIWVALRIFFSVEYNQRCVPDVMIQFPQGLIRIVAIDNRELVMVLLVRVGIVDNRKLLMLRMKRADLTVNL